MVSIDPISKWVTNPHRLNGCRSLGVSSCLHFLDTQSKWIQDSEPARKWYHSQVRLSERCYFLAALLCIPDLSRLVETEDFYSISPVEEGEKL